MTERANNPGIPKTYVLQAEQQHIDDSHTVLIVWLY